MVSWYVIIIIIIIIIIIMGHAVAHCATSRNIAGSVPDGVAGIFNRHNPSGRTVALGSMQPLTNEYQEYFLGVQAAGA